MTILHTHIYNTCNDCGQRVVGTAAGPYSEEVTDGPACAGQKTVCAHVKFAKRTMSFAFEFSWSIESCCMRSRGHTTG